MEMIIYSFLKRNLHISSEGKIPVPVAGYRLERHNIGVFSQRHVKALISI